MTARDLRKPAEPTIFGLEPLVDVGPVAKFLNDTKARVYRMCKEELIPHVRVGRRIKFSPEIIREWVKTGGSSYPGGWRRKEAA